jgi:hypothetical protein
MGTLSGPMLAVLIAHQLATAEMAGWLLPLGASASSAVQAARRDAPLPDHGTVRSSWTSRPDETLNPLPARTAPRAMRARSLPTDRPATPHPFTPDVRACLREQRRARR